VKRIHREFDRTKPVYVYRNLNAGRGKKVYSVMQNGRVVRHVTAIMLRDITFVVREKTRQKVLRTGKKAVHAFAKGHVVGSAMGTDRFGVLPVTVIYNPYNFGNFFASAGYPVKGARAAILNQHGMTAAFLTVDKKLSV
jgi:hypothetical protein